MQRKNNELQLHPSITENIGFMWNEELQDTPGLIYKEPPWDNTWVGQDNLLWETPSNVHPNLETWLYNNAQGEIILEVTPSYPYHFSSSDENPLISYQDFMRDYKPFLIRTISPSIAQTWLAQAEEILKMTEQNKQNAIRNATQKSSLLE